MTCYSGLGGVGMATSIATPMTCYSGLGGVGMGFLYIPGVVASQAHFTRRRALAVGIAVCGTGVGTLVLPPVVELMVETWGWRSALQALACLCLASTMCGLAMFPAPDTVTSTKEEERLEQTDRPPPLPHGDGRRLPGHHVLVHPLHLPAGHGRHPGHRRSGRRVPHLGRRHQQHRGAGARRAAL